MAQFPTAETSVDELFRMALQAHRSGGWLTFDVPPNQPAKTISLCEQHLRAWALEIEWRAALSHNPAAPYPAELARYVKTNLGGSSAQLRTIADQLRNGEGIGPVALVDMELIRSTPEIGGFILMPVTSSWPVKVDGYDSRLSLNHVVVLRPDDLEAAADELENYLYQPVAARSAPAGRLA